jgi:hypothetical protein
MTETPQIDNLVCPCKEHGQIMDCVEGEYVCRDCGKTATVSVEVQS